MGVSQANAIAEARAVLRATATKLGTAGARDEALAEFVPSRSVLGVPRPARFKALGRAWRLGALLVDREGALWRTGLSVRVTAPGRPQYLSSAVEERRALRAAAIKSGFRLGDTVNYAVEPIDLDENLVHSDGPLILRDDEILVRWGSDSPVQLALYLDDLGSLLLHTQSS